MSNEVIPSEKIAPSIHVFRGQKVLLDFDLAALYGVATKVLNQAVKRNAGRFPVDFMFRLTTAEVSMLRFEIGSSSGQATANKPARANRSQFVTGSLKHRERLSRPYAFTEQGVAMLSSVLRSVRAVQVNIAIMRAFVQLRAALDTNRELARRFSELETRVGKHEDDIAGTIEAIRQLIEPPKKTRREIGFHVRETSPRYGTRKKR